jgi:hypothetical protein
MYRRLDLNKKMFKGNGKKWGRITDAKAKD